MKGRFFQQPSKKLAGIRNTTINICLLVPYGYLGELLAPRGVAAKLPMPPSVIGTIAKKAGVRLLGREQETTSIIRRSHIGPVTFADDLDCFALK
jgi:hypothetical protein